MMKVRIIVLVAVLFTFLPLIGVTQSKDYSSTYPDKQKDEIIRRFMDDCSFNEEYCKCLINDIMVKVPYHKLGSSKYKDQYDLSMKACKHMRRSYPPPFPPPGLQISEMKFVGAENKDFVQSGDLTFLTLIVRNSGQGSAYDLFIKIREKEPVKGLQFDTKPIGDLKPGEEKFISIDIRANKALKSGLAEISMEVIEGNGFNVNPSSIFIKTLEFQSPDVRIVNYDITTVSGKVTRAEESTLSAEIQNIGQGKATNVLVELRYPDNTFSPTSNRLFLNSLKPGESSKLISKFLCNTSFSDSALTIFVNIDEMEGKFGRDTSITIPLNQPILPGPMIAFSDLERDIPVNKETYPNRFALIIGNEDYTNFQKGLNRESDVLYAGNDARTFRDYARSLLGVPKENCRLVTNATSARMNLEIELMSELIMREGQDCELFFYYAGHGLPEEGSNIPYLIPVDVNMNNIGSGIKTSDLYAKFAGSGAKRITIILDACFSGGGRDMGLLAARSVKIIPSEDAPKGNMVVFSATTGTQSALPYNDKRHGIFTYYFLKKLKESAGDITYQEMDKYLQKEVPRQSLLINEKKQEPVTKVSPTVLNEWGTWRFYYIR